jgi:hypothetical protein
VPDNRFGCRYDSMREALKSAIYGNTTSDSCMVTDCETGMGVNVSMRMRLKCEIRRAGKTFVDEGYEVRCPACCLPRLCVIPQPCSCLFVMFLRVCLYVLPKCLSASCCIALDRFFKPATMEFGSMKETCFRFKCPRLLQNKCMDHIYILAAHTYRRPVHLHPTHVQVSDSHTAIMPGIGIIIGTLALHAYAAEVEAAFCSSSSMHQSDNVGQGCACSQHIFPTHLPNNGGALIPSNQC